MKVTFDPKKRIYGILFAITTAVFWGFLAIFIKMAVFEVSPVTVVWFRFAIAFTILLIYFLIKNPSRTRILFKPPLLLVIAAVGLIINYIGFATGIHYTSPGNAQIFIQTGPMLLTIIGVVVYKERLSLRQISGFLFAGIGFLFFYHEQLSNLLGSSSLYNSGVIWVLTAAVSWTMYAALQKKLVQKFHAQQMNMFIYGLPVLVLLPFVHFSELTHLNTTSWVILVFLGINTVVAYGCLAESFKYIEANKVSIIITLNPIITFVVLSLFAVYNINWVEAEIITFKGMMGAGLVLFGAVLVVLPKKLMNKQRA